MNETQTTPTLAEIVAGLRKEADQWDRLPDVFGVPPEDEMRKYSTLLRAAADRMEGLAKLAEQIMPIKSDVGTIIGLYLSMFVETYVQWFAERDRLTK